MKDKRSLKRSVKARLKDVNRLVEELSYIPLEDGMDFHNFRIRLDELNQCFHEFNAYRNCLETN